MTDGFIGRQSLLVEDSIYEQVLEMIKAYTSYLVMGDPFDPAVQMGPVINEAAAVRIQGMIDRAPAQGARLITGGDRAGGELASGFFIAPTVFADVDPDSELSRDEVFGPVVTVTKFADEQEAVRLANDTEFGLAAYIWTRDIARGHSVADQLQAGNV
jgi:aldehyde dehydrogenase (NAD+)